ncbi:unnamed protein product [Ostreobium quekettii]|uniref:Mitochondrial carrier protein n=1 Tax=Ostreobium quekettii TaxID=121088 RepID=A0A8S1IYJ3_9CHLO|nr:unnamed protein product [Ostreobium quekettii]|eukprot:evm.model.scf_159.9 EVM.evm.TU.scf_159.9   scf_159:107471-112094(+)
MDAGPGSRCAGEWGGVCRDDAPFVADPDHGVATMGRLMEAQYAVAALSDTVRHVIAGTFARTMAQAFVHPIDTIKTRLQVRSPPEAVRLWKKKTKASAVEVQVVRKIFKFRNYLVKGPADVYLGLTGAILGTLPTALVYFATYECTKEWMAGRSEDDSNSPFTHLMSASAGAVASSIVRVPTDTMRHRVQAYMHSNIFQAGIYIARKEGMRGLYAGFLPTLLRDVPEIAVQFALYERLRVSLERHRKKRKLQTWEHLILGGACGACAAVLTMPLDVAKTTMQCGRTKAPLIQALTNTLRDKGVKGLFVGMYPRITQVATMSAVFFTLFEFWKLQLKPVRFREPGDRLLSPKIYGKRRTKVWKRQFVVS